MFAPSTYALDIFDDGSNSDVIYCKSGQNCNLEWGINQVKTNVNGIVTNQTFSEFVQDKVVFLMGFVTLIAVLYIIFSGFKILTAGGDEKAQEGAKKTIISIFLGMLLMWLSYAIVKFIMDVLVA